MICNYLISLGKLNNTTQAASRTNTHAQVWAMAWPIILANVTVPLLGAVDTAVVGHLPEPYYIGAVAIGAMLFNYIYHLFNCLRMGTTGPTAQARGAGEHAEVRAMIARALLLAGVIGSVRRNCYSNFKPKLKYACNICK